MIYCGYQGCGKSTYCRNHPYTAIDLDSSVFKKCPGWEHAYVELAQSLSTTGKDVFISAHQAVILSCIDNEFPFVVLAPCQSKEAWRSRLEFRYHKNRTIPNFKAIADFEMNYEHDMAFYSELAHEGYSVQWTQATVVTDIAEKIGG